MIIILQNIVGISCQDEAQKNSKPEIEYNVSLVISVVISDMLPVQEKEEWKRRVQKKRKKESSQICKKEEKIAILKTTFYQPRFRVVQRVVKSSYFAKIVIRFVVENVANKIYNHDIVWKAD